MALYGSNLLNSFRAFHGHGTKQIGEYFCIPASLANALRTLGCDDFSQERIRDEYYHSQGRALEPSIDDQMTGVSFDVFEPLRQLPEFSNSYATDRFERPGDHNPFDMSKAEEALQFIIGHLRVDEPVIISTYWIPWEFGILQFRCCHMWLALAFDDANDEMIVHDPGDDSLSAVRMHMAIPVIVNGRTLSLEIGVRGRITHTDYNCLAITRRRSNAS